MGKRFVILKHGVRIVVALTLVCAVIVCAVGVYYTAIRPIPRQENLLFASPEVSKYLSDWWTGIQLTVVVALACALLLAVLPRVHPAVLLVPFVLLTAVYSFEWVSSQHAVQSYYSDVRNIIAYAKGVVLQSPDYFEAKPNIIAYPIEDAVEYFSHYPFQAGMMHYCAKMFDLFCPGNILALQTANIVGNEIVLVSLYCIVRHLFKTWRARNLFTVLMGTFLPFWMSCAFPYGNCVGFAFAVMFVAFQVEAMAANSKPASLVWAAVSVVPLAVSFCIKTTYILIALAVVACWVARCLGGHTLASLAVTLAIIVVARWVAAGQVAYVEEVIGSPVGDGMPTSSWIMIGLKDGQKLEGLEPVPGWWDLDAYYIYAAADGDLDKQSALINEQLGQIVQHMLSDPAYTWDFFCKKLASEWADPTFMSNYYPTLNIDSHQVRFGYADKEAKKYLKTEEDANLLHWYDGFTNVIYVFAVVGIALFLKSTFGRELLDGDQDYTFLLFCLILFVGFGCYLLWEAKGVYLLPFFVLMMPLSVYGMDEVAQLVVARVRPLIHRRMTQGSGGAISHLLQHPITDRRK